MPRHRSNTDEYKGVLTRLGLLAQRRLPAHMASPDWLTTHVAHRVARRHDPRRVAKFIRAYGIDYRSAERCGAANSPESCAQKYPSLDDFFTRRIRGIEVHATARVVSPATCRAVLYDSFPDSRVWVKGKMWSAAALLGAAGVEFPDHAVGIFRLRPKDYHRFHSPIDGTVAAVTDLKGRYLSVDPSIVRSRDVFTVNHRVVYEIRSPSLGTCYFVAVGAAAVGTIKPSVRAGERVQRGQELGAFGFGGSTVVLLVPAGAVRFDPAIAAASRASRETFVAVGQGVAQ